MHESLDRLESTCDLLVTANLSGKSPDAAAILLLRRRFAVEFRGFLLALDGGLKDPRHRALHTQLQNRAEALRTRLMSYTMAWQPAQIDAEPAAFRAAAREIAEAVRRFIADTRTSLDRAGVA